MTHTHTHTHTHDIQVAHRHLKKGSTSLIIIETQMETIIRYHLTSVRIVIIKNLQTVNVGEDVEKRVPRCTVGGNVN